MADTDRITLVIEGLPEDEGRVRLGVFMSQLQSLSATIAKLDRDAHAGRTSSYYRIAELSYKSPVRVVLEPQPVHPASKQPYDAQIVIKGLERVAVALQNGDDLSGVDADLLEDIRALARPVGKTVKNTTLLFNGVELDLTPRISAKVDAALAVHDECEGSIEGMLEQINVHEGANIFHVYPEIGPRKLTCRFPSRLYDDAVSAVGRRVEVSGTLRYRIGATFPHEIMVSNVEAFPAESALPDWEDLRGRAPNATGELSSDVFVRGLRDAWR
jgi:hypothetical protein